MVVQRWDETIAAVAEADLPKDEYKQLEDAVLKDSAIDQEILSMLQRCPGVFHIGMLPSCSSGQLNVDEAAKAVVTAHREAASGQLKVFEAELHSDWVTIAAMSAGSAQLAELLKWLALEHRRGQAALAEALVARRMAKHHLMLEIGNWQQLTGQLSLVLKGSDLAGATGTRRLVMVIDFNTPKSRDALKLSSMISAMASAAKVIGAERSIVMALMPNVPKEGSDTTPDEDEFALTKLFAKAGFMHRDQVRWRQLFNMHPSVANKTSSLDWFVDGRLLVLGDAEENDFLKHSELARIRCIQEQCTLPLTKDLVSVTSMDENVDVNITGVQADIPFKCAQRGPQVFELQLKALMAKVPLAPKDETVVLDLLPHVGDRQLGLHNFIKSSHADNRGLFRGVIVKFSPSGPGQEYHTKAANFAQRRLSNRIAKEWLDRNLVLYDTQTTSAGTTSEVAMSPMETARPQA